MPTEQLKHSVQALAAPAEAQLTRFPAFAVAADELALEFDDARGYLAGRERALPVTPAQAATLGALDRALTAMSTRGDSALWTTQALRSRPEWREVRALARAVLRAFGWPADVPPPPPGAYVPGRAG